MASPLRVDAETLVREFKRRVAELPEDDIIASQEWVFRQMHKWRAYQEEVDGKSQPCGYLI